MVLKFTSQVIAIDFLASFPRTLYHLRCSRFTPAFSKPTIQGQDSVPLGTLGPKAETAFLPSPTGYSLRPSSNVTSTVTLSSSPLDQSYWQSSFLQEKKR